MTAAERTYRLALRAYPAAYRDARGAEILATLAEMQGARRRPEVRQVRALLAGGIRAREAVTTGGTTAGMWAEGCRLAAFVLLLLAALRGMYVVATDIWFARFGMAHTFTPAPAMSTAALMRSTAAVLFPWLAAAALCRGRTTLAIAGPVLGFGLFLSGSMAGLGAGGGFVLSIQLAEAILLAAPIGLLLVARGGPSRPSSRYSPAWLLVPVLLAALELDGYYASTITFAPFAALVFGWFIAARLSPHLAVAAFAVLVPVIAFLAPFAVIQPQYEYAVAYTAGAVVLALASLASAIALGGGDAELEGPRR
jgi:hypothetical protein